MGRVTGQSDLWWNSQGCAKSRYRLCSSAGTAGNPVHFIRMRLKLSILELKPETPWGSPWLWWQVCILQLLVVVAYGLQRLELLLTALRALSSTPQQTQGFVLRMMTQTSLLCLWWVLMDLYLGALRVWVQTDTNSGLAFLFFPTLPLVKFSRSSLVVAAGSWACCFSRSR